jgi:23S rRNA (guanosine2251-2'-O)-methyltransferase
MTSASRGGGGARGNAARGGQGGRAAKAGSHRKGAAAGSGGQGRKALQGRGATPAAELRTGHPAQKRAAAVARRAPAVGGPRRDGVDGGAGSRSARVGPASAASARTAGARAGSGRPGGAGATEILVGRNAVVEALRAGVPASELYLAGGLEWDERLAEARRLAAGANIGVVDVTRPELDRLCDGAPHQGLGLTVPAYDYAHPDDLLAAALAASPGLLVALDGVTDPRNLGAVVRSAAAFGAHGVVIPERRAAGMTAAAWKTSAGAAARLRVARATNLTRTLAGYATAGLFVVGLAADGDVSLDDLETATDPLVLVVGSEGRGLSRLVGERCDLTVRIPMNGAVESLNAGVAAGVALAEIARRRRQPPA